MDSDHGIISVQGGININGNELIEANEEAIRLVLTRFNSEIAGNEKIVSEGTGAKGLIHVINARNELVSIARNLLVAGNCEAAVAVNKANAVDIERNFIDATLSANFGVLLEKLSDTDVEQNRIVGNGNNIGLEIAASRNVFQGIGGVNCNCIENTSESFFLPDQGTNFEIGTNEFNAYNSIGLHYGSDAMVGVQEDTGNEWAHTAQDGAIFETTNFLLIDDNAYLVSANIATASEFWPGPNNTFWDPNNWFDQPGVLGTADDCGFATCSTITPESVTQLTPLPPPPSGSEDVYDIESNILDGDYASAVYAASTWLAGMYLYEKAQLYPSLQSDPDLYNLLNHSSYADLRDHAEVLYALSYSSAFDNVSILNEAIITALENGTAVSVIHTLNLERMDSVGTAQSTEIQLLQQLETDLSSISTTTTYESNDKSALEAWITLAGEDEPTESEINTLRTIAEQCRLDGGRGVILARGALDFLEESYTIPTSCAQYRSVEVEQEVKNSEDILQINPNPSGGRVYLKNTGSNSIHCQIYGRTGQLYDELTIPTEETVRRELPEGLWFISVLENEKNVQTSKIVITKR